MTENFTMPDSIDLKLNETAGRKAMERLMVNPVYKKRIFMLKGSYFMHHIDDHLKLVPGGFDEITGQSRSNILKYQAKHPEVWQTISDKIDRHIFLIVTAFESMYDNTELNDDKTFCHVYKLWIVPPLTALWTAQEYMQDMDKLDARRKKRNPRWEADIGQALNDAMNIANYCKGIRDKGYNLMTDFIAVHFAARVGKLGDNLSKLLGDDEDKD